MGYSELYKECVRLSPYSQRLRALGKMWERLGLREVPRQQVGVVERLIKDVKIAIGEQITPEVYWPPERVPRSTVEALRFLQHPELFDTETYRRMLWHAAWPPEGTGHPRLRAFADAVLRLGRERLIPLYAELGYVPPAFQAAAFARGATPVRPEASPHCDGRAVVFQHAVDLGWPGSTLSFLRDIAKLASAEVGVAFGWSRSDPRQFVLADDDGVLSGPVRVAPLLDELAGPAERGQDEALPRPRRASYGEGEAMLAVYSGKADAVPWNTAAVVQPLDGKKSRRPLPDSGGRRVSWTYGKDPETGAFRVFEVISEDGLED